MPQGKPEVAEVIARTVSHVATTEKEAEALVADSTRAVVVAILRPTTIFHGVCSPYTLTGSIQLSKLIPFIICKSVSLTIAYLTTRVTLILSFRLSYIKITRAKRVPAKIVTASDVISSIIDSTVISLLVVKSIFVSTVGLLGSYQVARSYHKRQTDIDRRNDGHKRHILLPRRLAVPVRGLDNRRQAVIVKSGFHQITITRRQVEAVGRDSRIRCHPVHSHREVAYRAVLARVGMIGIEQARESLAPSRMSVPAVAGCQPLSAVRVYLTLLLAAGLKKALSQRKPIHVACLFIYENIQFSTKGECMSDLFVCV